MGRNHYMIAIITQKKVRFENYSLRVPFCFFVWCLSQFFKYCHDAEGRSLALTFLNLTLNNQPASERHEDALTGCPSSTGHKCLCVITSSVSDLLPFVFCFLYSYKIQLFHLILLISILFSSKNRKKQYTHTHSKASMRQWTYKNVLCIVVMSNPKWNPLRLLI